MFYYRQSLFDTSLRRIHACAKYFSTSSEIGSLILKEADGIAAELSPVKNFSPAQHAFIARFGYGLNELAHEQQAIPLMHPLIFPASKLDFYKCTWKGSSLVKFFVYEFLFIKYPRIPTVNLNQAVTLYTNQDLVQHIVKKSGIAYAMTGVPSISPKCATMYQEAFMAILGSIGMHHSKGLFLIRSFVHENITNRMLERSKLLNISENPKQWLYALMKRLGEPIPEYRMEGETGRQSNSPMFLVGVHSGDKWKLGEGHGPSISIAETRAARNALERYYLHTLDSVVYDTLPSSTLFSDEPGYLFSPLLVPDTPAYPLSVPF